MNEIEQAFRQGYLDEFEKIAEESKKDYDKKHNKAASADTILSKALEATDNWFN